MHRTLPENQPMEKPELAALLELEAHPEGGWYRETWRSGVEFEPEGYGGARASATAIYFLLAPGEESRSHQVRSAEIWLWHSGGPLTLEYDDESVVLGPDVRAGQQPQVVIPPGAWQAARPAGDEAVLVSCVVSPGFDFADFSMRS
jgi:predicted cupin superfamily sugar epimerase